MRPKDTIQFPLGAEREKVLMEILNRLKMVTQLLDLVEFASKGNHL